MGGRTIAEAKKNIAYAEFLQWAAFRNKYGSLFFGRRIEQSFGNWMAHYTRFKVKEGTEVDATEFMPHEPTPELTYEQMRMQEIEKKKSA